MMMEAAAKIQSRAVLLAACTLALWITGCATTPPPAAPQAPVAATPAPSPPAPSQPEPQSAAPAATPPAAAASFRLASWKDLPGWREDNVSEAWTALLASCKALGGQEAWREPCATALRMHNPDTDAARRYFEKHFTPHQILSGDGAENGLMTGYYEPLLRGSRKPSLRYRYAVYSVPEDLLVIDLTDVYPELKGMRLRGRLEGRRVVPYYERAKIENGEAAVRGRVIVWVDDAIELFFLHIQGSGRIALDSGETIRVGYAEHNGRPYRSIGRLLVERGELALDQASMQGIKAWARQHPAQLNELLDSNASYVFFRELPAIGGGPPGSLGVPLTPRRSVAVDARYVPLGAPVWVATTWPNSTRALNRLMLAQDTGGAIRGPLRGDFFWGYGEAAAREAGRMKQSVRMWLLLPNGYPVPAADG